MKKKFTLTIHSIKKLNCSQCGKTVKNVDSESVGVICSTCCSHYGGKVTVKAVKESSGFPRGWKLYKQFVHTDGRVYISGVEDESLKGTLDATVITAKPKISKYHKEQARIAKEKKLAAKYEKKMDKKDKVKKKKEKKAQEDARAEHVEQFFE